jgi:hypothetical protein
LIFDERVIDPHLHLQSRDSTGGKRRFTNDTFAALDKNERSEMSYREWCADEFFTGDEEKCPSLKIYYLLL